MLIADTPGGHPEPDSRRRAVSQSERLWATSPPMQINNQLEASRSFKATEKYLTYLKWWRPRSNEILLVVARYLSYCNRVLSGCAPNKFSRYGEYEVPQL